MRRGMEIPLSSNHPNAETIEWVQENEALEIRLTTTDNFESVNLELYEHSILHTDKIEHNDGKITFLWRPVKNQAFGYEKIFINYFGIAEFNVSLKDTEGNITIEYFNPIEVLASKINADRVDGMLKYLSKQPKDTIHSVFRTTRHSVSFGEGQGSPSLTLERVESILSSIQDDIQLIYRHPITKLTPENKIVNASGFEEIDDSSMGWLLSNISVLSPTDTPQDAHLTHNSEYLKASLIQVPILVENSDLYENRIIHGFILSLTQSINDFIKHITSYLTSNVTSSINKPKGYTSFFDQIHTFKNLLLGDQINRCGIILDTLKCIKTRLELKLPVKHWVMDRPILTPKARQNSAYRNLFLKIISWHECGKPDWSSYDNLFAIKNISTIFETYCYLRTLTHLNSFFRQSEVNDQAVNHAFETQFIDNSGQEIWLRKEPTYWMANHNRSIDDNFINTEGWSCSREKKLNERSSNGTNSHRKPDISIEVSKNDGSSTMIVLDAKYTTPEKAFIDYLPELTMKYVHGIHQANNGDAIVSSLTIMHPSDNKTFKSFHHKQYCVFGEMPVSPNLQSIGLVIEPDGNITDDGFNLLLERILTLSNIKPSVKTDSEIGTVFVST